MNLGDFNAHTYFHTKHGISLGRRSNRIWSMRMRRKGHMSRKLLKVIRKPNGIRVFVYDDGSTQEGKSIATWNITSTTLSECCEARITEAGEFCTLCWEHC